MRRILTAITATALALSLVAQATPAQAAVPGYLSSYFGESAFLNLQQGSTGQFVAIFTNTGANGWLRNSASQVNLGVCLSDKTTCNVTSPNSAWNDGSWLSNIAYATHSTDFVGPGQNGFFVYNVKAPLTQTAGSTTTFNGDLVLASTLQQIRPEGYYQAATVQNAQGPSTSTTCTGTVGGAVTCTGTATAPSGTTITGVSEAWSNTGNSTTGSLGCTADDGAFNEIQETFTCTGNTTGATGVVKITTTSNASNGTTGTETDYIGDATGPTTTGALGTQGTSEFNHYTGSTTDTQTPISNVQYRVLNPDATTKVDWTSLPAADGAYNELTETINFRVDTTGFANGVYIVEVRAFDGAGNTGNTDIENMTVSSGADTTAPACSGTLAQTGLKAKTTGTATDDVAVSNVEVKVQRQDAGVWTDVTTYTGATADDGAFNETSENFTQTTSDLTIPNSSNVRSISRVTDSSGNQATCTSNTVVWNTVTPPGGDTTDPTVTVTSSSLTPGTSNSITFTGTATDNVGVVAVEIAVTRFTSGTTVQGFTACSPNDGLFSETTENFTCTATLPTSATSQAGDSFVIIVRGKDAAGNTADLPGEAANPTSGAFGTEETCSFFTQQSSGASTTGTCVWTYDNRVPFISISSITDAGTTGVVDTGDQISLQFPENLRAISSTTPQSISLNDGTDSLTLTNGVNSCWTRTNDSPGAGLSTILVNVGTGTCGPGATAVATVNSSVNFPATITGLTNVRDWAGNSATLTSGDTTLP